MRHFRCPSQCQSSACPWEPLLSAGLPRPSTRCPSSPPLCSQGLPVIRWVCGMWYPGPRNARTHLIIPIPLPGVWCRLAVLRSVPEGQAVREAGTGTGPVECRGTGPGTGGPSRSQPACRCCAVPLASLPSLQSLPHLPLPLLRLRPPPSALGSVSMALLTLGSCEALERINGKH